jgi:hypothetical protein
MISEKLTIVKYLIPGDKAKLAGTCKTTLYNGCL